MVCKTKMQPTEVAYFYLLTNYHLNFTSPSLQTNFNNFKVQILHHTTYFKVQIIQSQKKENTYLVTIIMFNVLNKSLHYVNFIKHKYLHITLRMTNK